MNDEKKKNRAFKAVGVFFTLVGIIFIILSIFYVAAYDKVEGEINVTKRNGGKRASITYEYDGITYEDKVLSSYNAFTMKTGKMCTVYVSPDKPDKPKVTNFGIGIITALLGITAFRAADSESEKDL